MILTGLREEIVGSWWSKNSYVPDAVLELETYNFQLNLLTRNNTLWAFAAEVNPGYRPLSSKPSDTAIIQIKAWSATNSKA